MKLKQIFLAALIGLLTAVATRAQDFVSDHFTYQPAAAAYLPNELSLDVFGFGATSDKSGADHSAWGPGVGLNYFVTQFIGFGADTYSDAFTTPYLLNGNAIFRYPFDGTGVAPYAFGGFGREWTHAAQWLGDVGAGVEYRFTAKTSVFSDFRGVFPGQTRDYGVWRFGFRLAF